VQKLDELFLFKLVRLPDFAAPAALALDANHFVVLKSCHWAGPHTLTRNTPAGFAIRSCGRTPFQAFPLVAIIRTSPMLELIDLAHGVEKLLPLPRGPMTSPAVGNLPHILPEPRSRAEFPTILSC
jgi:hypothetical protein